MTTRADESLPLEGMVVIDTTDVHGGACGRFLAELGATVTLVEPPGGITARHATPRVSGVSVAFATGHVGKSSVCLDLSDHDDLVRFEQLLEGADIWIDGRTPGAPGPDVGAVRATIPHLVILALTGFGHHGPYADWQATDPVLLAMSGFLSRSGIPGRAPMIPPGAIASEAAGIEAAWAALLGHYKRLQRGDGDLLDFSLHDAIVRTVDPPFGAAGTASVAASGGNRTELPRGRVEVPYYPTFRVSDGYVRIVSIATRQWYALRDWIGSPEEFMDPRFDSTMTRFLEADSINAAVGAFFANLTVAELVSEGQLRGLPIAPVLSVDDVLASEHFQARSAVTDVQLGEGTRARMPSGYVCIGDRRTGLVRDAAALDRDRDTLAANRSVLDKGRSVPGIVDERVLPLSGLRVLDLGVIVMGGEAARMFADQGADVVKVENRRFPDGARGPYDGPIHASFAVGHRNMRSIGLDLRHPGGARVFLDLVREADVLLSNFKPGTLEKLGFGEEVLRKANPRLVMVSCSAFGDTGPWRGWMGYGPLVRAASGIAGLWRCEDEPHRFGDSGLTYPDHIAARVVDAAALACVMRSQTTRTGAHVRAAQSDAVLNVLAQELVLAGADPETITPHEAGPWGVYPCAGEDEWCVITVRDDRDWKNLRVAIDHEVADISEEFAGADARRAHAAAIDDLLASWTSRRPPNEVMTVLQAHGVPAGAMLRPAELLHDPHLRARRQFRTMVQPELGELTVENGVTLSQTLADPPLAPAPLAGQHTRAVCADWLGLSEIEIDRLYEQGGLETDLALPVAVAQSAI